MNKARNVLVVIAWFSCMSVIGFLTIDYLFTSLWPLVVLLYFWSILAVFLIFPVSLFLLIIPTSRKKIGITVLILNIILAAVFIFLVENSKSVDAMMSI